MSQGLMSQPAFALPRHLFTIKVHFSQLLCRYLTQYFFLGQLDWLTISFFPTIHWLELLLFNSSQPENFILGIGEVLGVYAGKTEILRPEYFITLALTGNCNYSISKWIFNLLKCVSPFSNHKASVNYLILQLQDEELKTASPQARSEHPHTVSSLVRINVPLPGNPLCILYLCIN